MKNIGRIVSDWVWQLPQNLLGVLWKNIKKDSIITLISNNDIESVGAKAYLIKARAAETIGCDKSGINTACRENNRKDIENTKYRGVYKGFRWKYA